MKKKVVFILFFILLYALLIVSADAEVVVLLDDLKVHPELYGSEYAKAHIKDNRAMVPVRFLSEALGADVNWEETTQSIILKRADAIVAMQIGSKVAMVNDKKMEMDVSPYIVRGRTFIPARYISEFFNQKVSWNPKTYTVTIAQDKEDVQGTNLEAWALPMAAMLNYLNSSKDMQTRQYRDAPLIFGGGPRWVAYDSKSTDHSNLMTYAKSARNVLSTFWHVENREKLIEVINQMSEVGHHHKFTGMTKEIKTSRSSTIQKYGLDLVDSTVFIAEKWGDKGIICWDAFRVSNLAQWGYVSGYLTYEEALLATEKSARIVKANFDNWQKAYENYLDGYYWWSGEYDKKIDIWQTERGRYYIEMLNDPEIKVIFNDQLFTLPIEHIN